MNLRDKLFDPSLRRTLLIWLAIPLLVSFALQVNNSYEIAKQSSADSYDLVLTNSALTLTHRVHLDSGRLRVDLPPESERILREDKFDSIYFAIATPGNRLLAGDQQLPIPTAIPSDGKPLAYDTTINGLPIRAIALRNDLDGHPYVVAIAETLNKRIARVREIQTSMLVPKTLLALMMLLIIWFGVRQGLRPLDQFRAEIAKRSHHDLSPVDEGRAPREIRPLVREINQLMERLSAALDAQNHFLADASHQLRTPLAGLQNQLELLLQHPEQDPKASLSRLLVSTRRTVRLANQLLALARAEPEGHRPDTACPVDLARQVADSVDLWVQRAMSKDIDLGFDCQPATIHGEPFLIRELLSNLIGNALDYTQAGGTVTVRCGVRANHPFLEVEDNGPGIPEAARERVFQRFFRLPGSPEGGCGLGLAIVKEIAEGHGARISICTPASGVGVSFIVQFPPCAGAATLTAPASTTDQ